MNDAAQRILTRFREHPGRGGCGVGAVSDLRGRFSRHVLDLALAGLGCLEHRGGSIEDTGDGAGLLLSTDPEFFRRFVAPGRHLPQGHQLSVGVLFFPPGEASNLPHYQREVDAVLRRQGLAPLGWRKVPVDERALGAHAKVSRRDVWQVLMAEGMVPAEGLPRAMFRAKAKLEGQIRDLYVASFSPRTLVYKVLGSGEQLRRFYPDLQNPELRASTAVFHRRYSTNTFSNWYLAQVFRQLCHNGEINSIKANRNATHNLEAELGLGPLLMPQGSDSADLDRVVELFTSHGVSLPEALCRMLPMAWKDVPRLNPAPLRFFQGVQRALGSLGAWEGPAGLVAYDGRHLVGALDRMGLRPLRYVITRDGKLLIASEMGSIPVPFEEIEQTGQLDPGEMIAVDLDQKRLLTPSEVLDQVVRETPINFAELSEHRLVTLQRLLGETPPTPADPSALNLFGWTHARLRALETMAETGKEPITSMGYDRPLPVLSSMRPPVTKFFKQIVAVVTNPPLDPLREEGAFDLTVHLGPAPTVQENVPIYDPRPQYRLASPFLAPNQLAEVRAGRGPDRPVARELDCTFDDPEDLLATGGKAISRRIAELVAEGLAAVKRKEAGILLLTDRRATEGLPRCLPLPMVLVTSALHNALVDEGLRRHAGILVDTGEIQEGHDGAVLIANGADALSPYLFLQAGAKFGGAQKLLSSLDECLKRIMSKMGILSVDGYRGSRLFEAVGLAATLTEHYLPGIPSRLGGLDLEDLYEDVRARKAQGSATVRDQDLAVYRKEVWNELQTTARGHDPLSYQRFLKLIADTPPVYLRDLLRLKGSENPATLESVVPAQQVIAQVFRGAAMSHGALHRIAHQAIAAAFNAFGSSSNCGEGGEDPQRDPGGKFEEARSRIRQVASGRFGVDARYLAHADELSIKIGQGAKPGEGGMLPAAKVTEEVARIRRTQVGVALISPPPHHDIYSIEDLAQLIYNLRQINPRARISVKIPAVSDIGTIAVGIAKAGADVIDVSGFEGGTGAASSSSIEHAGLPLERALSETHQALCINEVRHRVKLRADGGIKTGLDVVQVLCLGADEVSLGTALMIAEQCIFCHGCHNGLCPAGITTQSELVARRLMTEKKGRAKDPELPNDEDQRYLDAREGVKRYLIALAEDVRRHLAALGAKSPAEVVGRVELLERKPLGPPASEKVQRRAAKIDFAELLTPVTVLSKPAARLPVDPTSTLNAQLCAQAMQRPVLQHAVSNTDRAIGATLCGKLAKKELSLPDGGLLVKLTGCAGQGLGFGLVDGVTVELTGFANDTVGEAMGGGALILRAPRAVPAGQRGRLSICGNAAAYGATGGKLFVEGRVGQRVGVRNSGALIVVEGAGKYAFEYMTGGVGIVLGPVGTVVGSGMTGGALFLLDDGALDEKLHPNVKKAAPSEADDATLRALVEEHARETGSHTARELLNDWPLARTRFCKVVPV